MESEGVRKGVSSGRSAGIREQRIAVSGNADGRHVASQWSAHFPVLDKFSFNVVFVSGILELE
jgi:hypothetical protein